MIFGKIPPLFFDIRKQGGIFPWNSCDGGMGGYATPLESAEGRPPHTFWLPKAAFLSILVDIGQKEGPVPHLKTPTKTLYLRYKTPCKLVDLKGSGWITGMLVPVSEAAIIQNEQV